MPRSTIIGLPDLPFNVASIQRMVLSASMGISSEWIVFSNSLQSYLERFSRSDLIRASFAAGSAPDRLLGSGRRWSLVPRSLSASSIASFSAFTILR